MLNELACDGGAVLVLFGEGQIDGSAGRVRRRVGAWEWGGYLRRARYTSFNERLVEDKTQLVVTQLHTDKWIEQGGKP